MIENEEYLEILMTRCLSEENQLKFVQYWPEKVCQYLETLEKELNDGRGAYLCEEAQDLYDHFCEEIPSLPKLKIRLGYKSATSSPFAALAGLL